METSGNPFDAFDDEDVPDDEFYGSLSEEEIGEIRAGGLGDREEESPEKLNLVKRNSLPAARELFWQTKWELAPEDQVDESDILGLRGVKRAIKEIITLVTHWEEYSKISGIKLPRGLLLYGRPGNGKTMCLRWIITSMHGECFNVRDYPLALEKESKWTDKDIQNLYEGARKRFSVTGRPVILIWDEMDAYVRKDKNIQGKDSVASALCTEMDGIEGQSAPIFLVGTANYTGGFEEALTRAGRLSLSAECVQLSAEDATKMLIQELDRMDLPHPSSAHIEDLLGDGDRSAIEIKEAVSRAKMRAIVSQGELTVESIGRALLEQMIQIPNDSDYDDKYISDVAWHEIGHALFAHALGLKMQRIDVHRVATQAGSIVLSEKAIETQIDGFSYVITAMGGKMMEIWRLGIEDSSLFKSLEDYRSIVQNFTASMIQSGGYDGRQMDWKSLSDRMDFTADERAQILDKKADALMYHAGHVGEGIICQLNSLSMSKNNVKLTESLEPLAERLINEGVILGSDAFQVIEDILGNNMGWYREEAISEWKKINSN